jgi:hypothetical protein
MKKFLLGICLLLSSLSYGQAPLSPDGMTKVMEGTDDGMFHVQLGHSFPYYDGVFTDAWMSSNGFILLYDPISGIGNPNTYNSFCCNGENFQHLNNIGADVGRFSYMLAPLWTDLYDPGASPQDGYYYKTDANSSQFLWYDIIELYNLEATNTFGIELLPSGEFSFQYDDVNLTQGHTTFFGFTGNLANDNQAYNMLYFSEPSGSRIDDLAGFANQTDSGYYWSLSGQYTGPKGPDCSNPLNDTSCQGYDDAYKDQQCSNNPLYDTTCTGYDVAYLDQQCNIDSLYDTACPGYQEAIAVQSAAGTDFIFGDDISDFYEDTSSFAPDTTQTFFAEEPIYDTEEPDYGMPEPEVFFESQQTAMEEPEETHMTLSQEIETQETLLEEIMEEPVFEEISDASFSEELTHVEGDMSNPEEELLTSEVLAVREEQVVEETTELVEREISEERQSIAGPSVMSIIMQQLSADASFTNNQVASQNGSNDSSDSSYDMQGGVSSFGSFDSQVEEAQIDALTDPTMMMTNVEEAQEEQQVVEVSSTTAGSDPGFNQQQDVSFSTGQSITAVLNNVQPNFSQFDVAPPSQQEQKTTQKAEAQANNMSDEQLEKNLDELSDNMKDSGGFGDQSMTIFLMGRVNGFDAYSGKLPDTQFYVDRGMPGGRINNDRNSMLQLIGTNGKHEELIAGQYK